MTPIIMRGACALHALKAAGDRPDLGVKGAPVTAVSRRADSHCTC